MKSALFTLVSADLLKGLIVAVLTAVVSAIYTAIQAGGFPTDWKPILLAAAGAGLAYILKNFLSNSDGQFMKKENP